MKSFASNLIKISTLILVITFLASCRDRNKPKNYFIVEDTRYEIKSGEIINNGESSNGFSLDLRLYNESKENFLSFVIVSPQAESIPNSTYTNFEGSWVLGYKDGSYTSIGSINTGKVVINRSSDGYSIEIECVDQYSNKVEGRYKGELTAKDENNLVKKLPEYVFNFEGAYRYELMEEYYPEQFEKLKEYVAKGNWYPCGAGWENGDVNVPSPEALFRNFLLGNEYFNKKFGIRSRDVFLPDCFGFGYALPSIARHANLYGFTTQKLSWGSAYGQPFDIGKWYGPDGKYIIASRWRM